jgi:hypothetical protein
MSALRQIWQDLRSKRLVPVAAGLLVAIVAVPVVLSSSSAAPAVTPPPAAPAHVSNGLPAVNDTTVPASSAPSGSARNPFGSAGGSSGAPSTTPTTTLPAATTTPTSPSGPASGTGSTTGGTGPTLPTPPQGGQTPPLPPTIPLPQPKPATPALSPDQSYSVSLALTKPTGGLDTISPLQRLSPLPSASRPLLVELGVLRGGGRVLFAVQPGTVVSGKGTCIPGPIDCEILSLAQGRTERLSVQTNAGLVHVALFAVTGIAAVKHPSRSAAMKVRNQESRAGRRVLQHASLNALKLFRYETSAGAVIDLRNLILRKT